MRRTAFDDADGFADEFQYAMEETDLALRLIDRDWTILYDATPAVVHPHTDPARHPAAAERTMRNRVWLAYRNLPAPLALCYVANWFVIAALRRPRRVGDLVRGVGGGWRGRPRAERRPIRWRTVARLTRLGRPPVV
jgi:GT2 family glycosyltransferase